MKHLAKLNWASALIVFGSSLTWTGLPALLYIQTGSIIFSSLFFVSASIARILASLFAGYFIDKIPSKKLTVTSLIITNAGLLLLFAMLVMELYIISFFIMMVVQFLSSVYSMSKTIWYRTLLNESELIQGISKMNSFEMTAKTAGFTLGPVAYIGLGLGSILLSNLFAGIALLLIFKLPSINKNQSVQKQSIVNAWKDALQLIRQQPILRNYTIVSILNGIILPTLLSLATVLLLERYEVTNVSLSLFWFLSGVGVIGANMLMTTINVLAWPFKIYGLVLMSTMSGGLFLLTIAPTYLLFLIGFLALTFSGPIAMNVLKAELFKHAEGANRGKVLSLIQAASDFGTLCTIMISWIILDNGYIMVFLAGLTLLSIVQGSIFLLQMHKSNEEKGIKKSREVLTTKTSL